MPLWRIFSHPNTFSTVQKQALVESITPFYTRSGLPAFYVNVVFIPVEPSSFYIGNKPVKNMVRIAIEHIAIHRPKVDGVGNNLRASMCLEIDKLLAPHIEARGDLNWEYHIQETPRDLWRIQGLKPPPFRSLEEKLWSKENKALAWENGELIDEFEKGQL